MATVEVEDPDVHRKNVPVDDRGRVVVGKEYSGQEVTVIVEVKDEPESR